jgi:FkbM family methyltransferase
MPRRYLGYFCSMKFLVPAEKAVRRLRNDLLARLHRFDWFKVVTLVTIKEEIVFVTKQFDDHRLTFSPYESIGNSLFRQGHYQRDLANRALSIVGTPTGKTLLEIGANIGTHTVYLTRGGQLERVICVEPEPRNLLLLKQNLLLNDLADRTTVVECAVGDQEGVADFYFDDRNYGASSLIKRAGSGAPTSVRVRRVDEILRDLDVSPDDIGLVWMDIEGAELAALRSMSNLIARRVPILLEYAPARYEPTQQAEMVASLTRHYSRCIVFSGDTQRETDIGDLPAESMHDVLLLP